MEGFSMLKEGEREGGGKEEEEEEEEEESLNGLRKLGAPIKIQQAVGEGKGQGQAAAGGKGKGKCAYPRDSPRCACMRL